MRRWRGTCLHIGAWGLVVLAGLWSCGRERENPIDPNFPGSETLAPPSNLQAQGGIGRIVLTWNAVNSGNLAGYGVWRATSSTGNYIRLQGEVADSLITTGRTTFVDTTVDLSASKVYFYRVNTIDVLRQSSALSVFVSAEVQEDKRPPAPPTDLSAVTDENTGFVVLTWNAPLTDVNSQELTGLSGYKVFRSKDTQDAFVQIATVPAGQTTFTDSSALELDARYFYRVSALDGSENESSRATPASITTTGTGVAAPAGLRATGKIGEIEVRWNPVSDPNLLGYLVLRSTSTEAPFRPVTADTLFTTAQTVYVDAGVVPGTVYFYRIQSVVRDPERGIVRSEPSPFIDGQAEADQSPPAAPSDLIVSLDEANIRLVSLSWTPPTTDSNGGELTGLATFRVFRSRETASSFVLLAEVPAAQVSYRDSTVEALTRYFYAVSAVDSTANVGPRSTSVSVTTRGLAAPTNLRATPGLREIALAWTANTEPELTGYEVLRFTDPSQTDPEATYSTVEPAFTDSLLTPGQTYVYRVRAVGTQGIRSALSTFVSSKTRSLATPANLRATAGPQQVVLTWTANTEAELTGYEVLRFADPAETAPQATFSALAPTFVDSPLAAGQTFVYRVRAVGTQGIRSDLSTFVSATPLVRLAAPRNVAASADVRRITITWTANTEAELTGYRVLRFTDPTETQAQATFTTLQTSYVDSPLAAGRTFVYRVQALGAGGLESQLSNFASATVPADTRAPATPGVLSASLVSGSVIRLSWSAPRTDAGGESLTGLSGYQIYRSEGSGSAGFQFLTRVDSTRLTYTDSGLELGATYIYRVSAVDAGGNESALSSSVSLTTSSSGQVAAPEKVQARVAVDPDLGQVVQVTWTAPAGISQFRVQRQVAGASSSDSFETLVFSQSGTSFTDSNVAAGTTYVYRVLSISGEQFSEGKQAVVVVPAP